MAKPRSVHRALKTTAAATLAVAALAGVGVSIAYLERRTVGLRLATDYLRAYGVASRLRIDRLDAGGFAGALALGPPADPDLSVERVEVQFAPLQFGLSGVAAPRIRTIRLIHPVLKARLDERGLSFGSLQRLIDASTRRAGGGAPPDVTVVGGRVRLDTSVGLVLVDSNAVLHHGRLIDLSARLAPTTLAAATVGVRVLAGELSLVGRADRLHARWRFAAASAWTRAEGARQIAWEGETDGPYPTTVARANGRLNLASSLRLGRVVAPGGGASGATVRLTAAGVFSAADRRIAFHGDVAARTAALSAHVGAVSVDTPSLTIQTAQANLSDSLRGPAGAGMDFEGPLDLRLAGGRVRDPTWAGLFVRDLAGAARGRLRLSPQGLALDLAGNGTFSAALAPASAHRVARGVPAAAGADLRAAMERNLSGVRVYARAWRLSHTGRRLELRLDAPVRADFAGGAVLELARRSVDPVITLDRRVVGGGLNLALTGPALPKVVLDVRRWSADLDGRRTEVKSALAVEGDVGPLTGAFVHARTRLTRHGGALALVAADCADFGFTAFGPAAAPTLRALRAQLCPGGAPLLNLDARGLTAAGRITALQALAPAAGLALTAGDGAFVVASGEPPHARIALDHLRLADTVSPRRITPLVVAGAATLGGGVWSGALRLGLDTASAPVGRLTFDYDPPTNRGQAQFASTDLRFSPHGLQPSSFWPGATQWISAVDGPLRFAASVRWTAGRLTSRGELSSAGLDLQTPAGRVHALAGDLVFDSLYPLTTASVQSLRARALDTPAPLSDLAADFDLAPGRLTLRRAEAAVADGRAALDPITLALAPPTATSGVLRIAHVDVERLLANFGLADSVSLQARLSGALPFTLRSGALAVAAGRLTADGPGRLTIRRAALGGAVTTAGAAGAQPNAVQDFAYQALENLAFDALEAEVASRPPGRLGVVLHIHGRHDPPTVAPTRVRLLDLLQGHAFDKPLPLPKGTGVDLTLDTSLNLDEVLGDYGALRAQAGSAGVQPGAPK